MHPYLFRTQDFGKSWTRVSDGLPQTAPARVLREDPKIASVLYAGTEQSVFVSFDDGRSWRPLGMDLPTTPITGIVIEDNDLVVSTEGSGFWVLRGLETLRQARDAQESKPYLFAPADGYVTAGIPPEEDDRTEDPGSGGVAIDLYRPEAGSNEPSALRLEVLDSRGNAIRTLLPGSASASAPGLQRIRWDLRRNRVVEPIAGALDGTLEGSRVPPGEYRLHLTGNGVDQMQRVTIRWWPVDAPPDAAALTEKQQLLSEIEELFADVSRTVSTAVAQRQALSAHDHARAAAYDRWERQIFNRQLTDSQARVNLGGGLLFDLKTLTEYVDGAQLPVTEPMKAMSAELASRWRRLKSQMPALD
jgi:hypothetical protein